MFKRGAAVVVGFVGIDRERGRPRRTPDLQQILERLTKLEEQNRQLTKEVRELRAKLGEEEPAIATEGQPAADPLVERVEVAERRIAELDQTRVATDNRLPVRLTGMLLFNAYWNGSASAGAQYPVVVPPTGPSTGRGRHVPPDGDRAEAGRSKTGGRREMNGSVYMDFFGGGTGLNQTVRPACGFAGCGLETHFGGVRL
ncbi:MAG: hypothetical protein WDO18_01610 [Acidobacteriota bacterium]